MARQRDHRSAYERRNDQARRMGYSGYSARRRALRTGEGRLGPDMTEGERRKRVRAIPGGEVVQLTANNRGRGAVSSRAEAAVAEGRGADRVTISYVLDGKSGEIRRSISMTYADFMDAWDGDAYDAAYGDAEDTYTSGSWSGAVGSVQVQMR